MVSDSVNTKPVGKRNFQASLNNRSSLKPCIVVGIIAMLGYANSLFGEFVYDDYEVIQTNNDIRPTTPIFNLFKNDFWGVALHSNKSHKSYRPITVLSFRCNFFLGALNPIGYHAVNIILHGITSVLFLLVCERLFGELENSRTNRLPFLCGLFFAVHPIHTEAVANSVGRADILCAFFYLSAIYSYMKSFPDAAHVKTSKRLAKHSRFWLVACVYWGVLSLFSKEQGISAFGVCTVYDLLYVSKITGRDVWRTLPSHPSLLLRPWPKWALCFLERIVLIVFSAIILLYLRIVVISGGLGQPFSESDNPTSFHRDFWTRLRTYSYLCAFNAWLLLCPSTLCFDWSMDSIPRIEFWSDMRNVVTMGFGLAAAYMSIYGLTINQITLDVRKDNKTRETTSTGNAAEMAYSSNRKRVLLQALSMTIIPFVPASNLFFPVGFVVAERILYIPSMGVCILVVLGISVMFTKNSSNLKDSNQNTIPGTSVDWSFGLNKIGKVLVCSVLVLFILKTFHRNAEWKDNETLSKAGLKVNPTNAKIYMTMGNALAKKGKLSCEPYYREALRLRPQYVIAWENLGLVLLNTERQQEAEQCYLKALSIRPNSPEGNINLAHLLRVTERYEEANVQYGRALNLRPNHPRLNHFHGAVLEKLGQLKDAEKKYTKATRLAPNDPLSFLALGKLLVTRLSKGRNKDTRAKQAEDYLRKGVNLKPSDLESRLLLAELYLMNGRTDSAEIEARKVLKQNPYSKEAEYILGRVSEQRGLLTEAKQLYYRVLKKDFTHSGAKEAIRRMSENYKGVKPWIKSIPSRVG